MSLKHECACDLDGVCPYDAEYIGDCEYWCGEDEPIDVPAYDEDCGFDPYMGCYTDDC